LILAKLLGSGVNNDENVEDFCRLYIFLALATFYFSRSSRNNSTIYFHLLENVQNLNMYNWGAVVHSFLVQSLNRAALLYNQQHNTVAIQLLGCVVVLQVSIIVLTI